MNKRHWFSIKPLRKCLYTRRNGFYGTRVFGFSICLRLFGKDIL